MRSVKSVLKVWEECSNAYKSMAERVAAGTMTAGKQQYKPKTPGNLGSRKGIMENYRSKTLKMAKTLTQFNSARIRRVNFITLWLSQNQKVEPAKLMQ
jgi:hypothetical protein